MRRPLYLALFIAVASTFAIQHRQSIAVRPAAAASSTAAAATSSGGCSQHFLNGREPALLNALLNTRAHKICYTGFAVLTSGATRTALWSAEHLTRESIASAHGQERENNFHPDPNLPEVDRAELGDYTRSGYDRGHMSPSGDMPNMTAQYESFSLANMIPQNPDNNRNLWEWIEATVRGLARYDGEVYVITGPIFQGDTIQRLHGRVAVPTALFKAIYDPRRALAGAYVTKNAPGAAWRAVSLAELAQTTGIDVFPDLPTQMKQAAPTLPEPRPQHHAR